MIKLFSVGTHQGRRDLAAAPPAPNRRWVRTLIPATVVALMAAGAMAWASVPDAGGVIHTCYSQASGTWRPIDYPTQKCKAGETQLDFNQKGVKGDTGATGPTGATGSTGPAGPAGSSGPVGAVGPSGAPGTKGDPGLAGTNGVDGTNGTNGNPGTSFTWRGEFVDGAAYNVGDAVSFDGSAWITSKRIDVAAPPPADPWQLLAAQGQQGIQGPAGSTGPQGPAGSTGPPGPAGTGGVSGYLRVSGTPSANDATTVKSADAFCPGGRKVLGGGGIIINGHTFVIIWLSRPSADDQWSVIAEQQPSTAATNWYVQAYAICGYATA